MMGLCIKQNPPNYVEHFFHAHKIGLVVLWMANLS